MKKTSAYEKSGVDIEKADRFVELISPLAKKTHHKKVYKAPSGYAGLYQIDKNNFIAATTDGVGTKLKIAFELDIHNSVGIDLVAMSVNDLICVGAKPLFFLDYFATGKLKLKTSTEVLKGIAEGCSEAGVALIGGETAEMPGFYSEGEYDLAGFAVGMVNKKDLITGNRVKSGDVLLALKSTGAHSNGYSLVRKILKGKSAQVLKQALTPTKIYVEAFHVLKSLGMNLHGLSHITGSGFLNVPRMNDKYHYEISYSSKNIPSIFSILQKEGKLTLEDMFTTFNMGVGLVAAVSKTTNIPNLRKKLQKKGYESFVVGKVGRKTTKGESPTVFIDFDKQKLKLS